MFGQRRWHWNNITPALVQPFMFAGYTIHWVGVVLCSPTLDGHRLSASYVFNEHNINMLISIYVCFFTCIKVMVCNKYCIEYNINKI